MPVMSQKEVAKRWKTSAATICEWSRPGGPLAAAKVGKGINTDHPSVAAFISGRSALKPSRKAHTFPAEVVAEAAKRAAGHDPSPDGFALFEEFADLTLREIAVKAAGNPLCHDYLKAWDLYEGGRKKQLANDSLRGQLLERHLVETFVFGFLDDSHRQVKEAAQGIVRLAFEAAAAGRPIEEAERMARDAMTAALRPAKQRTADRLRATSDGEPPPEKSDEKAEKPRRRRRSRRLPE